jgi:hypothetical protein
MRVMFDSVTPSAIPTNAALVAGYINGPFAWTAAEWSRFPHSVQVRISVRASLNDGHVIDCENGDATPAQAVQWVAMRRRSGADPSVYCNASTWPTVQAAFRSAGVAAPHYWIAHYDGSTAIPAGAVAKQYNDPPKSGGNYDITAVADYWPGVDPEDPMANLVLSADDQEVLIWRVEAIINNRPAVAGGPKKGEVNQLYVAQNAESAALKALSAAVAAQHGLTVADVQNAVATEMSKIVTVDVNVTQPSAPTGS